MAGPVLVCKETRKYVVAAAAKHAPRSPTAASWPKRVDKKAPDALVQIHEPVNKVLDVDSLVERRSGRTKSVLPQKFGI